VAQRTAELKQTEERKSAILDNALDGIVSMDCDGRIVEFNPAAESIFGRSREEVVGQILADVLIPAEYRDKHEAGVKRFLWTGESEVMNRRIEITALRATGDHFPAELSITPVSVNDNTMFTAFVRDITERKRLETELAHAQKMESIGQLAAGVAHEINTPNQYIGDNILFLQDSFDSMRATIGSLREVHAAAQSGAVDASLIHATQSQIEDADLDFLLEEVPKATQQALEGVERVATIVRAMKEFSHPGQDFQTTVDLNRVIESTVTVARNEWKYVAKVDLDLQPDLGHIQGHPGELGQVLLNLIVNAVHAIKDRYGAEAAGRISITSRRLAEGIEVCIGDNGCGIPEHVQPKIFEPFYTTKGVGLGTGQGLAISHAVVVDHHGGAISFSTAPGEGTTFRILLPVAHAQEAAA
jgi:two-component system NtrC family sensor kinase